MSGSDGGEGHGRDETGDHGAVERSVKHFMPRFVSVPIRAAALRLGVAACAGGARCAVRTHARTRTRAQCTLALARHRSHCVRSSARRPVL